MKRKVFLVFIAMLITAAIAVSLYTEENGILIHETSTPSRGTLKTSSHSVRRALIADGLSSDFPNPNLIEELKQILKKAGYEVDVAVGEDVNLTLFSHLTKYSIIIMRVHGGIGKIETPLYQKKFNAIFTGVLWNEEYEGLLEEGLVARGHPFYINKTYVAVKREFFRKRLEGRFPQGSVMIVAGCYSLYTDDIAKTLLGKGLEIFIGWKGTVSPHHMDEVLISLVRKALIEGKDWVDAVKGVNEEIGPDPVSGEELEIIVR